MKGADIHTVAQLLGHKNLRMAARYQHLWLEYLGEAVKRLDGLFSETYEVHRHHSVTDELGVEEAAT